jgi:prepilin-type N-terminal cleavage/methylation domain-containing protein
MVNCSRKLGFTLVEVLVVVAIMGILSGIGVASLRSAVANSRIKDAGINVTAFMQRAANEATRLNEKLCAHVSDDKTLKLYKGACGESFDEDTKIDEFVLESLNKFVTASNNVNCPVLSGKSPETSVTLTPKIGVSPIPTGCFLIRYGETDRFAASIKESTKFSMYYELSYNSGAAGSWFEP